MRETVKKIVFQKIIKQALGNIAFLSSWPLKPKEKYYFLSSGPENLRKNSIFSTVFRHYSLIFPERAWGGGKTWFCMFKRRPAHGAYGKHWYCLSTGCTKLKDTSGDPKFGKFLEKHWIIFPVFCFFGPFLAVFSPQDPPNRPPDTFFQRFGPIFIQIRWLWPILVIGFLPRYFSSEIFFILVHPVKIVHLCYESLYFLRKGYSLTSPERAFMRGRKIIAF